MKKALLIVNLGTPDSPSYFSVFKYLREFLSDEKVLNINPVLRFILVNFIICPLRSFSSSKIYKKVWDKDHGSPLLHNTKLLADKLDHKLANVDVQYAMRYQSPSIKDTLNDILSRNPDEVDSSKYEVTFQSRLTNKWLSPFTDDVLKALPQDNKKNVLVFSPAFTEDCLETIIEIGDEYKELFYESGGTNLDYVPSLNFSDKWVDAIVDITNMNEGDSDKNV